MKERKTRRDPEKETFWRDLIKQWETTGLSIRDFCKEKALKESSFHYWRREVQSRDKKRVLPKKKKAAENKLSFATVQVPPPFLNSTGRLYENEIEVSFSNGNRIRFRAGIDSESLEQVFRTIGNGTC